MNKTYLFSNRDLRKLIVPLILEQALAITVGMADTMMISSAGEAAVSGVSLVDMLNVLMFSVLAAFSTGGAVVVSQNIGANNKAEARSSAKQLLACVLCASVLLMFGALLFKKGLLKLFFGSVEADVMEASLIYLTITAISFPFLGLYNACAALFRAMGRSGMTFKIAIVGNLINVIGNAVCVLGFRMGVAGVAIPSLLSRMVMGLTLYILLKNSKYEIGFDNSKYYVDVGIIKRILYIGIPSGIENGIFELGKTLVVSIISGFGTVQIAASGVAMGLDNVGTIVGMGMNLAMLTVIGRCVGAKDSEQIRYYTWKLLGITYAAEILLNVILFLNLDFILSLYGLSAETTALAKTLVLIHNGCAVFMWPLSFTLPNMLRACNDVRFPMVVSIISRFVFRVGFSYVLGVWIGMGVVGVWIAMIFDWVFRIICFMIRYYRGEWKKQMYK